MNSIRVESEDGTHEAWLGSRCLASTRDFTHRSLRDVWETATDRFESLSAPARIYRRRVHQTPEGVRVLQHELATK
jgi:hypothetical protein